MVVLLETGTLLLVRVVQYQICSNLGVLINTLPDEEGKNLDRQKCF